MDMQNNKIKTIRKDSERKDYMELNRRIKEMEIKYSERKSDCKLPWWADDQRGVPVTFLKSGLYAVVIGSKKYYDNEPIITNSGISIKYTGYQLTQYDLELWENLVHIMRHESLGTRFTFTINTVLKVSGLSANANTYQRIKDSISKMVKGTIEVRCGKVGYIGSLFNGLGYNLETMKISISLNPELIELYTFGHWLAINRDSAKIESIEDQTLNIERTKVKQSKPLYQFIEGYYLAHKEPLPVSVQRLYDLSGSTNKQQSGFKRDLKKVLNLLIENKIIIEYTIDSQNKVIVKRN